MILYYSNLAGKQHFRTLAILRALHDGMPVLPRELEGQEIPFATFESYFPERAG